MTNSNGPASSLTVFSLPHGGFVVSEGHMFSDPGSLRQHLGAFSTLQDALRFIEQQMTKGAAS